MFSLLCARLRQAAEKLLCGIGRLRKGHLSGFELGHIQNVVDQRQQELACILRARDIGGDCGGWALTQHHLVHTQHNVDGCADFVAHVCEKDAFCLICIDRLPPCLLKQLALPVIHAETQADCHAKHDADGDEADDHVRHQHRLRVIPSDAVGEIVAVAA